MAEKELDILIRAHAQNLAAAEQMMAQVKSLGAEVQSTTASTSGWNVVLQEHNRHGREAAETERDVTRTAHEAARAFDEWGAKGGELTERFGALAGVMSLDGPMGLAIGGALVGMGALTAGVGDAFEGYRKFGEEVLQVQRETGASAEETSKLIDVSEQLGVSYETLSRSLLLLNQHLDGAQLASVKTQKSLGELGVQTVQNADGTTNLVKTLGSVADAYNETNSAAEKDTIAYAAFGRQAQELLPLLQAGSSGLQAMEDASSRVFTQEDVERVHHLNVEMTQMEQENNRLKDSFGSAIASVWLPMVESINDATAAHDRLNQTQTHGRAAAYEVARGAQEEADAHRRAASAAQEEADRNRALEASLRAVAEANDKTYKSDVDLISVSEAHQRALLDVSDAMDRLKKDQDTYGISTDALKRDQLGVEDAMIRVANSAVDLAEKHAGVTGATLSAYEKTQIFQAALAEEEKQLAPDSPLRRDLAAYAAQLNNIPRDINTNLSVTGGGGGTMFEARQSGGEVLPGRRYTVGEAGAETLVMGSSGGYVIPNGGGGGGSGSPTVNVYVTSQADPFQIADEMVWAIKAEL